MVDLEKDFEEYLIYLYELAARKYSDCSDVDSLIQDTVMALVVKMDKGEIVEYPKGFLSAVMKNKYNEYLRQKYRNSVLVYEYSDIINDDNDILQDEEAERREAEYESVRREIGRLIRIYREVTVRFYVHGHSVERIANDLGISKGTVKSRLASARGQIKEGLENMEKYSNISYEPKTLFIGIWGYGGLSGEPFSLINSNIESNILIIAYERPVSVRGIADMMGMPCAYIEPLIDKLVEGELMGRTNGGLVYTRCYMQSYSDAFGDIEAQEALADKYAEKVWEIVWRNVEPLTHREAFEKMSEKQKATMLLYVMNDALTDEVLKARAVCNNDLKYPPERPNAGRWLATATVFERGEMRNCIYENSGPCQVSYSKNNDGEYDCRMFDCQSLFGEAHWAYNEFKYRCSLQSILRFYASMLDCDVKTDNAHLYNLIPEFEKLCILKRDDNGEIKLDIPALTFEEAKEYWRPVYKQIKGELCELLREELEAFWLKRKNRVPKHVDESSYFLHSGALGAYAKAQMLSVVRKGLMPYHVTIGKTPLIYLEYRKR